MLNQQGFSQLLLIGGLVILALLAAGAFLLNKPAMTPSQPLASSSQPVASIPSQAQPSATPNFDTSTWQTFHAPMEGFTLRYPNNWTVQDWSSRNCAHTHDTCKDAFDFTSPDGLIVRYVIHKDKNDDTIGCGVQAACVTQNVKSLEHLTVNSLGNVLLVERDNGQLGNEIDLDKPLTAASTPVVGANQHSTFMIDFSLPSKTGGRFILLAYAPNSSSQFANVSGEQFYNAESVKQAILILKSVQ